MALRGRDWAGGILGHDHFVQGISELPRFNRVDFADVLSGSSCHYTLDLDSVHTGSLDEVDGGASPLMVQRFADKLGIAPGIVVGRLQYEKLLPYNLQTRLFPCFWL